MDIQYIGVVFLIFVFMAVLWQLALIENNYIKNGPTPRKMTVSCSQCGHDATYETEGYYTSRTQCLSPTCGYYLYQGKGCTTSHYKNIKAG